MKGNSQTLKLSLIVSPSLADIRIKAQKESTKVKELNAVNAKVLGTSKSNGKYKEEKAIMYDNIE